MVAGRVKLIETGAATIERVQMWSLGSFWKIRTYRRGCLQAEKVFDRGSVTSEEF